MLAHDADEQVGDQGNALRIVKKHARPVHPQAAWKQIINTLEDRGEIESA